jgi:Kef-type K+ transport system membrane component KefB
MLVGLVMGPSGLNLLDESMLEMGRNFVAVALGLILFKLGSAIHPKELLSNPRLLVTAIAEATMTFLAVLGVLYLFDVAPVVSLLTAAIFVSSSPAILVHVANEVGAGGKVTNTAKSLVAINNIISFLLFTAFMPFALHREESGLLTAIVTPLYQMAGSILLGMATAYLLVRLTRFLGSQSTHFLFPIVVSGIMITLGLSVLFNLSFLFATLTLGVATRWLELRYFSLTRTDFGYAEDIFFIVLFVVAGASLHLSALMDAGLIALCLIAARCLIKFLGVAVLARSLKLNWKQSSACGMLILPMAGMAIGLVQTTEKMIPYYANEIAALVFAAVAVLETIGPPLTKIAFERAGETGKDHPAEGNVS